MLKTQIGVTALFFPQIVSTVIKKYRTHTNTHTNENKGIGIGHCMGFCNSCFWLVIRPLHDNDIHAMQLRNQKAIEKRLFHQRVLTCV